MSKKLVELTADTMPKRFAIVTNGNRELSEQVQKFLFVLGVRWAGSPADVGPVVDHTDAEVLYVEYSGYNNRYDLMYSDLNYYETGDRKTLYPPVSMTAEIKVTVTSMKIEAETVEINGKTYIASKVAEALREHGVVEV